MAMKDEDDDKTNRGAIREWLTWSARVYLGELQQSREHPYRTTLLRILAALVVFAIPSIRSARWSSCRT